MRSCAIAAATLLPVLAAALGCAPRPAPRPLPPSPPEAVEEPAAEAAEAVVPEPDFVPLPVVALTPLWETVARPGEGLTGLAFWPGAGQRPWLLATAAASHRLVLFDAGSGELLREIGALGERAGRFREPVAVAVGGDLAFVVERGNARVQVLRLPGLATVGFLGEGELRRPAAVAVEPAGEGWTVWVGEEEVRSAAAPGGAAVAGGPAVAIGPEAGAPGIAEPGGSRAAVHRFEVAADGTPLSGRRLEVELGGARDGRLVALVVAAGAGASLGDGPALVAVGAGGDEVVAHAPPAGFAGRPLDVVSGAVAGAAELPCGAGGGWVVALEHGGLLAFSALPPVAAASLTIDGVDAAAGVAVVGQPLGQPLGSPATGTLYTLTADSRVVAVGGGELAAALEPSICR